MKPVLGTEVTSWLCVLAAFPFAVMGFVKYNGLTAEKFIWAWIKSEVLTPKKLTFCNTNVYYKLLGVDDKKKGEMETHDKDAEHII